MSDMKRNQMKKDCGVSLAEHLQGAVINLVEEGYSEIEIKQFIQIQMEKTLLFVSEYIAL